MFFTEENRFLDSQSVKVGVISDTHNLLRPEAVSQLTGSDLIIHAGDIGDYYILKSLQEISSVVAVRGNVDRDFWCEEIPFSQIIVIRTVRIFVIHNLKELDFNPAAEGFHLVISGHSHKHSIEQRNGVIYLNPGSAGKRRFKLPISLAKLEISDNPGSLKAEIIELAV